MASKVEVDGGNWQVESDLRTLIEATKIEKDPKRLNAAMKLAEEKRKELDSVGEEADEEQQEAE